MGVEIPGEPNCEYKFAAKALCPASGESSKSVFCPRFNDCVLPKIVVSARSLKDAENYGEQAIEMGQVPKCLRGKPYLLKFKGELVSFGLSPDPTDYF